MANPVMPPIRPAIWGKEKDTVDRLERNDRWGDSYDEDSCDCRCGRKNIHAIHFIFESYEVSHFNNTEDYFWCREVKMVDCL